MMTPAPSPSPNRRPKACTNRVPRPPPIWGRKSDTLKPSSHARTAVRALDGVNHTIVRWPGPALAATTWRPGRRYGAAASRRPISCASRVLTRPTTGARAKTASERSSIAPAGQPSRRDASEIQEDDSGVLEPRADDTIAPVTAPGRDERRGQRAHPGAPPQRAQQRHVFEKRQLGESPDRLEQRAPDEQPLIAVGQPVQRLAQRLAELDEPLPPARQVDCEPEDGRVELRHVHDGADHGRTVGASDGRTASQPARRASAGAKLSSTNNAPAIRTRTKALRVASRDPESIASAKNV